MLIHFFVGLQVGGVPGAVGGGAPGGGAEGERQPWPGQPVRDQNPREKLQVYAQHQQ